MNCLYSVETEILFDIDICNLCWSLSIVLYHCCSQNVVGLPLLVQRRFSDCT